MSQHELKNIPASVRARLLNEARASGDSYDQVLQYFAIERFLYRLSKTEWGERLIVKGAIMLRAWGTPLGRPTRDIDFLGNISNSPEAVGQAVRGCLAVEYPEDGLVFNQDIEVNEINVMDRYPGVRAVVRGSLDVLREIRRLGAARAIILGGTGAVSDAVERALGTELGEANVSRIRGDDRYATANAVAAEVRKLLGANHDGRAFVATGGNFPDALAAAPLAAANKWPIYLAHPRTGLSEGTRAAMTGVTDVLILGGTGVVSTATESYLDRRFGANRVDRLHGIDRYKTAVAISNWAVANAGHKWDRVGITNGRDFPDALAGGVLQGKAGSVMLLTPSTLLNPDTRAALTANRAAIDTVTFFGGAGAVSPAVRAEVLRTVE